METRKLSLQEMEVVEGSGTGAGVACGVLMGGWGLVLTYGATLAVLSAGASVALAAVWTGLTIGLCTSVS